MSTRRTRTERRDEVVQATLDLLAHLPLAEITTRAIADRVGVTQPALFRHFDSRDDLVRAVLAHTRAELAGVAAEALGSGAAPLDRLEALVLGILDYVSETPGVPRLLFQDTVEGEGTFREPLQRLVGTQRGLVAGLVGEAVDRGDLPPVDADALARLLLALIQGVILQWQLDGRGRDLVADGRALLALWRAGARAGQPARAAPPRAREAIVALDVRPLFERGEEPFDVILAAVERVAPDGVLTLTAPFRPGPMIRLLSGRGMKVRDRAIGPQQWIVEACGACAPDPLDLRDLPAPEPLEVVLLAAAALAPGDALIARVPQVPHLLLPRLDARGLGWSVHEEPDGTALLHVRRSP